MSATSGSKITKKLMLWGIIAVIAGAMISVGIWYKVSTKTAPHPDQTWSFRITGSIVEESTNITIGEMLNMPYLERQYIMRTSNPYTAVYRGVRMSYLLTTIVTVNDTATELQAKAADGYTLTYDLSELLSNENIILAYMMDGEYLESFEDGGEGYLRIIIPPKDENDFNGQRCLKNVVELIIQ
jgi:DMSO/TMAO reductase YedYZ molybdopterin-dependent catalytic subunit